MKTERVKNSVYNGVSNLICNICETVLSFIVRTIFIKKLGEQCLGIDGLFTNILSLLSLAELGFSTAISFNLYEPIAKKNTKKITELMGYIKRVYRVISLIIIVFGLGLLPFIHFFAKGYSISYNLYFIYLLYLFNAAASYITSYNTILLEADQKNYKKTGIKIIFNFIVYGSQLLVLFKTNNFILYLILQFLFRQIERIVVFKYVKGLYKNIDFNYNGKVSEESKKNIRETIKGLLFHKIGNYAVNGTDNILISSIVNISTTGIYSNYISIIAIFKSLINSVISATTASFGNLNVLESEKVKENSFNLVNFVCYTLSGYIFICLFYCINPFINLWIGSKYTLNIFYILIICINFYLSCLMLSVDAIKTSAGLYNVDRYVPIIQAIINLSISIILGIKIGLMGILLGTFISSILTVNIIKPIVIYKYIFKSSSYNYFINIFKNILLIIVSTIICYYIFNLIIIKNILLTIVIYGIIITIVYGILFIIVYINNKEFKYFLNMIKNKLFN